jgi:membrane protein DedA with SNARE-associated domain
MDIIQWGMQFILDLISNIGYIGIVLLMALESMCLPVPSEIVMPFGGYLAFIGRSDPLLGHYDLFWVAMAGTIGCVLGSALAYWIGYKGGRTMVLRYGGYVHLSEKHLNDVEAWFNKYGAWAIFVTRLLPIVRTFISLPAGMARYKFTQFIILSAVGSFIWCYFLAYVGYAMGDHWDTIEGSFRQFQILIVLAFAAVLIWYIWRHLKKKKGIMAHWDQAE